MRLLLVVVAVSAACGGAVVGPAAPREAVDVDAGAPPPVDDASAPPAPAVDAGPPPPADAPASPCADALAAVYEAPPGFTPPAGDARGHRVRCASEASLGEAEVASRSGVAQPSAVDVFRLAYLTTRRSGGSALATARVWLPRRPVAAPAPLVVWAHGSVGLADSCAPSRQADGEEGNALPWAAQGFPVIAPDFAGLGTEGVQGYADNHDTAQSVLDAARALRRLLPVGAADARVVLAGFSQGGGAVLAAQALERTYGSGGRVVAVVAFAPQWSSRLDSFGALSLLRNPNSLTIAHGYTKPTISVLRHYAAAVNRLGPSAGERVFPPGQGAGFEASLSSLCLVPLGGYVQSKLRVRDLMDDGLRTTLLACHDAPGSAACAEPGKSHLAWLAADLLAPDPQGAPVLYLQGSLDTVLPVAEEAACNLPLLSRAGVEVTSCVDASATHTTLTGRLGDYGRRWARAHLEGAAPPACASSATLPACAVP